MGALFGAWVKPDSVRRASTVPTAINYLEKYLWGNPPARRFGAQRLYYEPGDRTSFPDARITDAAAKGRVPVMSLSSLGTYNDITAGVYDARLNDWADRIISLGLSRGYFCFQHEPNTTIKMRNFGSRGIASVAGPEYIAAFQHIIDLFRTRGVTGWRYGIILTEDGYQPSNIGYWYLGDSYTNSTDGFLGADGYNWYPCKGGSTWRDFTTVFTPFMSFAPAKKIANGCHLIIPEVACQERDAFDERTGTYSCMDFTSQPTTAKRGWINDMAAKLKTTHSSIDVVCWFDSNSIYGWWMDTRGISATALANMGLDPYFGGPGSSGTISPLALGPGGSLGVPLISGSSPSGGTIAPLGLAAAGSIGVPSLAPPVTGGDGGDQGFDEYWDTLHIANFDPVLTPTPSARRRAFRTFMTEA